MKTHGAVILIITALLLVLLAAAPAARAAVDAVGLNWWTAASGGGTSANGAYTLNGTAGQAAPDTLQGGIYSLQGGFWSGGEVPGMKIFLPVIRK